MKETRLQAIYKNLGRTTSQKLAIVIGEPKALYYKPHTRTP